jgi:quercetin dioxygenase-like cupin family protein
LAIFVAALCVFAASGTLAENAATPAAGGAVARDVLSQGEPAAAPGEILQLVRFIIPAHLKLPVHTHPGMQTAWLEAGALRYTVVSGGPVSIVRAGGEQGTPGPPETLTAGTSTILHPGDSWTEPEGMVHFAENIGDEPVVILVASLLEKDAPPSTVVQIATPAN